MTQRVKVYARVNCIIRIPGHGEFMPQDMRFDPEARQLTVNTKEGPVVLGMNDNFPVELLDLEIPTVIRNQMKRDGWETMSMTQALRTMLFTFLSEN